MFVAPNLLSGSTIPVIHARRHRRQLQIRWERRATYSGQMLALPSFYTSHSVHRKRCVEGFKQSSITKWLEQARYSALCQRRLLSTAPMNSMRFSKPDVQQTLVSICRQLAGSGACENSANSRRISSCVLNSPKSARRTGLPRPVYRNFRTMRLDAAQGPTN